MRDGIYSSMEEMVRATDTRETGWSLGNRYGQMLAELFRKKAIQSIAECVRRCVLVERKHVCTGGIRMNFLKSRSVNGRLFPILSDYNSSRNRTKFSETEGCVLHKRRACPTQKLCVERKMTNIFVLMKSESDEQKETWVGKYYCCFAVF